ncbi:glycosyltransferase family 2 protein [Kineococcus auxinigenes]|uniref:glycosyltransferase family 2 protein n=1 Tax=unclassified Kineococcus TaxID=2621656 RepID=UPI003D7EB3A1
MPKNQGAAAEYDYASHARLAGPLREPPPGPYTVQYQRILRRDGRRLPAAVLLALALLFQITFFVWMLLPSHWPTATGSWLYWLGVVLVGCVGVVELLRLVNVVMLVRTTAALTDPVPVRPEPGRRVAFITTIVPGKEPVEMAEETLLAAQRIRYDGPMDVWLLDEGNDPEVRAMCERIGVKHFSRHGVPEWNQEAGRHRRKTKHGNYNAWFDAHGHDYEFWLSVDTDHVPRPDFAERLLGYFRDPDVAFVVGPQVYGQNYDNFVTKASESQQYLFHGVLQRSANKWGVPMFVGTNNAVRLSALREIGGLADSITEDAATSLVWHTSRNLCTGRRWKSVYTPDVLSAGEGPGNWSDYFTQQNRWARGTDEVMVRTYWKFALQLGWKRALHYFLLMSYYPSAAITWVLGVLSLCAYLVTGASGVQVAASTWLVLYANAAVMQAGLYFWNRRYNVSPHEEQASTGALGMLVSIFCAPMYVVALVDAIRNRTVPFEVTPKGSESLGDRWVVFRQHVLWGLLLLGCLVASFPLHHDYPAMRLWTLLDVAVCFAPIVIWKVSTRRNRRAAARPGARAALPAQQRALPAQPSGVAPHRVVVLPDPRAAERVEVTR